jgi:hypothetical protein
MYSEYMPLYRFFIYYHANKPIFKVIFPVLVISPFVYTLLIIF